MWICNDTAKLHKLFDKCVIFWIFYLFFEILCVGIRNCAFFFVSLQIKLGGICFFEI